MFVQMLLQQGSAAFDWPKHNPGITVLIEKKCSSFEGYI